MPSSQPYFTYIYASLLVLFLAYWIFASYFYGKAKRQERALVALESPKQEPNRKKSQTPRKYATPEDPKHHVDMRSSDPEFGEKVDVMTTKALILFLKSAFFVALSVFALILIPASEESDLGLTGIIRWISFSLFLLTGLAVFLRIVSRVVLYQRGLVTRSLFANKRYSYSEISYVINYKRFEGDGGLKVSFLSKWIYSFRVCLILFQNGKSIVFTSRIYRGLQKKMRDFEKNLIFDELRETASLDFDHFV